MKKPEILIFIIAVIVMCSFCAYAQKIRPTRSSGKMEIETDSVTIQILGQGNVPKFIVKGSNTSTSYKVDFMMAYQVTSMEDDFERKKGQGGLINLNSYSWSISDYVLAGNGSDETLTFNMTSVQTSPQFQFRVHVNTQRKGIKWDTIITGFTDWRSGSVGLSTCYKLVENDSKRGGGDRDSRMQNARGNEIVFGEENGARFSVKAQAREKDAQSGQTKSVVLRNGREGGSLSCVLYEKFDGSLYHDPEFTLTGASVQIIFNHSLFLLTALLSFVFAVMM